MAASGSTPDIARNTLSRPACIIARVVLWEAPQQAQHCILRCWFGRDRTKRGWACVRGGGGRTCRV